MLSLEKLQRSAARWQVSLQRHFYKYDDVNFDALLGITEHLPDTMGHLPDTMGHPPGTKGHLPGTMGHLPSTMGQSRCTLSRYRNS